MSDDIGVMQNRPCSESEREISPWCPVTVDRALMVHRWDRLTFLHWRYDPDLIQRLLPQGLTVETFDGSAWVGLVPFAMQVTVPHSGPVPWLSRFAETNVRTYVTAADGTTGVWFLSLDAARLAAVMTARIVYGLPYFWSSMEISQVGPVISYRSVRRWPEPRAVRSEVVIDIGDPFAPAELNDLDHWLTARWRLFTSRSGRARRALAAHPPWSLHHATVVHLDDQLVRAAGLPAPLGDPLVHWSPGVEVRVGTRRPVVPTTSTPLR
jgi:uncharacterized protein YqjF (DUF2071 family)